MDFNVVVRKNSRRVSFPDVLKRVIEHLGKGSRSKIQVWSATFKKETTTLLNSIPLESYEFESYKLLLGLLTSVTW